MLLNKEVQQSQGSGYYQILEPPNSKANKWRPQGRLLTTLFEHKNAVNTLAITENSQLFFTGSKLDQQVKIWKTTEFEDDVTSHSHFSIPTRIPVNQITTFD
jgi:WD40 repeat protein